MRRQGRWGRHDEDPVTATFASGEKRQDARRRAWHQRMQQVRQHAHDAARRATALRLCGVGVDGSGGSDAWEGGPADADDPRWWGPEGADADEDEQRLAELYAESEAAACAGADAATAVLCPLCRARLVACTRVDAVPVPRADGPAMCDGPGAGGAAAHGPGARFSCPCGFRLDVPGGAEIDLTLLDQCLQRRMREHTASGCWGEPVFRVGTEYGVPVLCMDCHTCQSTYPVL